MQFIECMLPRRKAYLPSMNVRNLNTMLKGETRESFFNYQANNLKAIKCDKKQYLFNQQVAMLSMNV